MTFINTISQTSLFGIACLVLIRTQQSLLIVVGFPMARKKSLAQCWHSKMCIAKNQYNPALKRDCAKARSPLAPRWAPLKIQVSDETTSHSTWLPKDGSLVAGYKPDKARAKIATRHMAYMEGVIFCLGEVLALQGCEQHSMATIVDF